MFLQKCKQNYKWIILCICFLMTFVCLGFCSGNKGMYLTAITKALGLNRSLFSINDSCRYIATSIMNLFFGSLLYKYGTRKMVAFGFITLIASTLIYAYADNIFLFYIGGTLLGIGLTFTTTTMAGSIVRHWFRDNIGRYTGIVFAANGIGGAVAAQIISPMINDEGNPFGYRTSYLVVVLILLITGVLAVTLLRDHPANNMGAVLASHRKKSSEVLWKGFDYNAVKKRPFFYLTALVILLTGFILQGISGVYVAHMEDAGLESGYIATVVSIFSLALTASKILAGLLYDKFGLRVVMLVCQSATTISFLALALLKPDSIGKLLALLFAVLYALALPLETLMIPLIVNHLFGAISYDKILGICLAMNYTGYALSAPLVNLCYDAFGSYKPILFIFSALMPLICILFQFVLNTAQREKKKDKEKNQYV